MATSRRKSIIIMVLSALAVLLCTALFSVTFAKWGGNTVSTVKASGSVGQFYVEYPRYATSGGTDIPTLEDGEYYLQVQKSGGMSDYYKMSENTQNSDEKMLTNVYLTAGTIIDMYHGSTKESIQNKKDGSATQFEHVSNNTAATGKVTANGYYDFYYEFSYRTMYAAYRTAPQPQRDLSKRSCKVVFKNNVTIVFDETGNNNDLNLHIWKESGAGTTWPGLTMNKNADSDDNTITLNCSYTEISGIIINYSGGRTGAGTSFFSEKFPDGLKPNCTYSFDLSQLSIYKESSTSFPGITVIKKDPVAVPDTTGATDLSTAGKELNGVQTVRKVNGSMTAVSGATDEFEYHNYICVSRKNEIGDGDNSICFVEFEIKGLNGCDLTQVPVNSIEITRADTDVSGNPNGGMITPAPRLYNYAPSDELRLSDLGHGEKTNNSTGDHGVPHYEDGMYCILFFADGKQQYFALDIKIVTTKEADFTLTASASNVNNWQGYEQGYGKAWGFYMGGLINNVWLWDPRSTTKMQGTTISGESDLTFYDNIYDGTTKLTGAYYPKNKIDLSLTINLTGGSIVKPYMLDDTGYRSQGDDKEATAVTTYLLPKKIIAPTDLYSGSDYYSAADGVNVNIIIPKSGEYTFRLVGSVSPKIVGSQSYYINIKTGESKLSATELSKANGWYVVQNYNFMVDELYISTSASTAEHTVTFDANGGTLTSDATQKVKFGESIAMPTDPTKENSTFSGWYTDAACTTAYDFGQPVTKDMTLYAKWVGKGYTVTFDANGGECATATMSTDPSGKLLTSLPTPTRDKHRFDGWFTEAIGGEAVTIDKTYTANTTVYAHWTQNVFTVTFNANGGECATTSLDTNTSGKLTSLPTPTFTKHHFDGWYTAASGGTEVTTDTVFSTDNTEIFAHWTELYTITFNGNDGTPSVASKETGADGTLSELPTATRDKHHFDGWYTAATDGTQITTSTVFTEDTTVYAHWTQNVFTITFDANGGTLTGDATKDTNTSGKLEALPDNPTKGDHAFDGWYTAVENGDKVDTSYVFTADTTVYAHWSKIYTVTFDVNTANGGSGANTTKPLKYGVTITPPDNPSPLNDLYDFEGWYTEATGGEIVETFPAVSGDVTYYAHYKKARIRIVLDASAFYVNSSEAYHIHAWETGKEWADRPLMVSYGSTNGKYACVFDVVPTGFTFTRDKSKTSTADSNIIFRYEIVTANIGNIDLGQTVEYKIDVSKVTIDGNNRIGIILSDGWFILNASYDSGWAISGDNRPNEIAINSNYKTINYGKFTSDYNTIKLSGVTKIILGKPYNSWVGDGITPGSNGYAKLENGYTYNIKNGYFQKAS